MIAQGKLSMREILAATDFSRHSHQAFEAALALAQHVAEAVVRTAPCQVLTIGPQAHAMEETAVPVQSPAVPPRSHCLVCAKPSRQTICDTCKAHIQGEALERKRRDEQAGHKGLTI